MLYGLYNEKIKLVFLFGFNRWAFDSTSITAHAVWQAFHDHVQTEYLEVKNQDEWRPKIISGNFKNEP